MKFLKLDANSGKPESFSLEDIFLAYQSIDVFTTLNFRAFVERRDSLSRALLLKMDLIARKLFFKDFFFLNIKK